jgi:hypothetical protein
LRAALELGASLAQQGAHREAAELLARFARFEAQRHAPHQVPEAGRLAALRRELDTPASSEPHRELHSEPHSEPHSVAASGLAQRQFF